MSDLSQLFNNSLITGCAAFSANYLALCVCRDNYGNYKWPSIAIASCVGTLIGTRYVISKTNPN
jgi:hypothetical protein